MMTCRRCGADTPRLTLSQRYCPTCDREVTALLNRPEPAFVPPWRRNLKGKDLTDWSRS